MPKEYDRNDYTFLSMKELYDANNGKIELPAKPILITMDDGYYSNYEYIYPILKKYHVKASIFIVTDKIGKEIDGKKYLGWNECIEMQDSGLVEIFNHSKRHVFYDKLAVRAIRDDVIESYKIIEKNLGSKDLKVFAYPYGAYTKETVWALKMSGIDMQVYDIGMNHFNNFNYDRKHDNHLALLNKMFNEDKIQDKIIKCKTMEDAFIIIKSYPLIGNFMAYQLVTDINYSDVVNRKEDEFTVAGPGSFRGIKKCFINTGTMSNEDIIRYMYEHQDEEFKRLNLDFKRIGNRPLQLIDCQNIFCELDKYCRQALPNLKSNRIKIKKNMYLNKSK